MLLLFSYYQVLFIVRYPYTPTTDPHTTNRFIFHTLGTAFETPVAISPSSSHLSEIDKWRSKYIAHISFSTEAYYVNNSQSEMLGLKSVLVSWLVSHQGAWSEGCPYHWLTFLLPL